jgi:hypothetical protein
MAAKSLGGRPDTFTQVKADAIIERVSMGEPLAQVCRDIAVGLTTWYDWVRVRPELSERIARAREAGFDMIAVDALRIADTPVEGKREKSTALGLEITTEDMLGHRKLQVETRLKLLAKWDPKRYGDKLAIGGADDLPPINGMTEAQLDAKIAALMASKKRVDGPSDAS